MSVYYDEKYQSEGRFWGEQPTSLAHKVLEILPPAGSPRLLEIGCGEGRDLVFFARNVFEVTGFDLSSEGVRKTVQWADELNLSVDVFQADLNEYRLQARYDVVYSSGTLQYIPSDLREGIIANYKKFTNPGGINAFTLPVYKPYIPREADADDMEHAWISGEIMTHYHDWIIEFFIEQILDDMSGGKFAVNRLIARNPAA
jgi:tellurite methyltransferase